MPVSGDGRDMRRRCGQGGSEAGGQFPGKGKKYSGTSASVVKIS